MNSAANTTIALPKKNQSPLEITAHGRALFVRRSLCAGRGWIAKLDQRVRWGNATEIREDIAHFQQYGMLPPKGKMW